MKAFLSFLILLLSIMAINAFGETISIIADEWCPYNCDPNTNKQGYIIDIAREIFNGAGYQVEYRSMNWSRSIDKVRHGEVNAIVGASKGDAPDFIFPEKEQGMSRYAFFAGKDSSWRFKDLQSLKTVKLGVIQDYDYGKFLTPYLKENKDIFKVQFTTGDDALESNIKKAEVGRIDVILEDENVFRLKVTEMGKADLFINAGYDKSNVEEDMVFIAFSPSNPNSRKYAEILSAGMDKIRKSGVLKNILAKYGLKDWVKAEP